MGDYAHNTELESHVCMEWAGREREAGTLGHQQVDVVAADVVLRQADDGGLQAVLPVVVRRVRAHKARQLRHLRRQHREGSLLG